MTQYISKDALVAGLKKMVDDYWSDPENTMGIYPYAIEEVMKYVDTLDVKEIDENAVPILPYSLQETIKCETNHTECNQDESKYRCGPEPRFKVGDVVFCIESYSNYEDEYEYGIVTRVELDKDDWVYTFDYYGLSTVRSESELVSDKAYTK